MSALFSMPATYIVLPLILTAVGAFLFGRPHTPTFFFLLVGCLIAEVLLAPAHSGATDEQVARQWAYTSVAFMLVWVAISPAFRYFWKSFVSA